MQRNSGNRNRPRKLANFSVVRWGFLAAVALLAMASVAEAQRSEEPKDLSKWGLHCFCITAVRTPHGIVQMDDNGRILYRARGGVTREELGREGIAATESQILLMETYGLLDEKGGRLRTSIPVMDEDRMSALRAELKPLAKQAAEALKPEVAQIREELGRQHLEGSQYAIVFGYGLDGLMWDDLKAEHRLPSTELTVQHPFWRGAFWAVYPERKGVAGTNEVKARTGTMVLTWNDRTSAALYKLEVAGGLPEAIDSLSRGGTEPVQIDAVTKWVFRDGSGLKVPVIQEDAGDVLYEASRRIGSKVANQLVESAAGKKVLASLDGMTREEAVLIAAHELIWSIADEMVEQRVLTRPRALTDGPLDAPDVRPLVFVKVPMAGH